MANQKIVYKLVLTGGKKYELFVLIYFIKKLFQNILFSILCGQTGHRLVLYILDNRRKYVIYLVYFIQVRFCCKSRLTMFIVYRTMRWKNHWAVASMYIFREFGMEGEFSTFNYSSISTFT